MARIISVADAFDAMMSDRHYRSKLDMPSTIKQLQEGAGTQFDKLVVETFITLIRTKFKPIDLLRIGALF